MNELLNQFDAGMGYTGDVSPQGLAYPDAEWFYEAVTWGRSDSGEPVNPRTALSHGPVWQAVNILAGDVGQLPLHVYRKRGDKRERDETHPVEWLISSEPNPYQTPAIWKETMMAWALLWGNGCSYIVRNGAGRPEMLIPLMPDRTWPVAVQAIDPETGEPVEADEWWIETDFGDGMREKLPYEDVFHIRGLATDGFWGLSAVHVAKNVIGTGLALRKHGNSVFQNGARPGGALEIPGAQPSPEVMRTKRAELEAIHGGASNAGKWMLLYNGTKFSPYSMNNSDAQWLEAMDLDREFVASLFMLPPYKLGSMKNSSTRANTEQQNTDYMNTSLSRHLNKFVEEGERKLLTFGERRLKRVYLKWIVEAFLRADLQARGAYYAQAKTGEWMTTNEIRALEDMNPIEGGDVLKNPAINPQTEAKPRLAPAPDEEDDDEAKDARRAMHEAQLATATILTELADRQVAVLKDKYELDKERVEFDADQRVAQSQAEVRMVKLEVAASQIKASEDQLREERRALERRERNFEADETTRKKEREVLDLHVKELMATAESAKNDIADIINCHVETLLNSEAKRIEWACTQSGLNVVKWAESYYESYESAASAFLDKVCRLASRLGFGECNWRTVAADHARDSKNRFMSIAGLAKTETLPGIGKEFGATVRDRKKSFVGLLLGAKYAK